MTGERPDAGRRLRTASILAGLVLAAAALLAWSQTWYAVVLSGDSAGHPPLAVGGDVAAPALAALAVAGAAGFGALTISGRFFRAVLALLVAVLGGCIVLSAWLALSSPVTTVEPAVTAATSVAGTGAVADLIGSLSATAWPWVALVAGGLLALLGVGILVTGRAWPRAGRRYEPVRFAPADPQPGDAGSSVTDYWDDLSAGSDPTAR